MSGFYENKYTLHFLVQWVKQIIMKCQYCPCFWCTCGYIRYLHNKDRVTLKVPHQYYKCTSTDSVQMMTLRAGQYIDIPYDYNYYEENCWFPFILITSYSESWLRSYPSPVMEVSNKKTDIHLDTDRQFSVFNSPEMLVELDFFVTADILTCFCRKNIIYLWHYQKLL